jgi:hypothetical protein
MLSKRKGSVPQVYPAEDRSRLQAERRLGLLQVSFRGEERFVDRKSELPRPPEHLPELEDSHLVFCIIGRLPSLL